MVRAAALTAILLFTGGAALAAVAHPETQWPAGIQANDWNFVSVSKNEALLIRPTPQPNSGYRRLWTRMEFSSPQDVGVYSAAGYPLKPLSQANLIEADCMGVRVRILQETYYVKSNLQGIAQSITPASPTWFYATPGTYGETELDLACASVAAPKAAAKAQ